MCFWSNEIVAEDRILVFGMQYFSSLVIVIGIFNATLMNVLSSEGFS